MWVVFAVSHQLALRVVLLLVLVVIIIIGYKFPFVHLYVYLSLMRFSYITLNSCNVNVGGNKYCIIMLISTSTDAFAAYLT